VGRTWDGTAWRKLLLGEAGVSIGSETRNAVISFSPASVNDSINYADLQGSFEWQTDRVDLGGVVGTRSGDQLTTLSKNATSWASISAIRQISKRLALSLSGGSYPIDPTQGFPGGRFVSLSLRILTGPRRPPVPVSPQVDIATEDSPAAPRVDSFNASRDRQGLVTITVSAPGADSVQINGDFTNWAPLALTRDSSNPSQWSARLPIDRGKYQMNIRINGGKWMVPPGVLSMLDEFGGTVGLLVVQ